jgi:hypothetical protein
MVKKAVRGKVRTKKALRKKTPTKQTIRKSIQTKVQRKLAESVKLARQLEKQNVGPDEIAATVKARFEGLSDAVVPDILRLAGGSIHVNMETKP